MKTTSLSLPRALSSSSSSPSPSPLTRHVFRALIANRPYRARGCLFRAPLLLLLPSSPSPSSSSSYSHGRFCRHEKRLFHSTPRRQMFDVFNESLRLNETSKPTPQNIERALTRLVDVVRARRTQTRPPPPSDVVAALKFLFTVRADDPQHLTATEIGLIAESLAHAQEQGIVLNASATVTLQRYDLLHIFNALAKSDHGGRLRADGRALADRVFQALQTHDSQAVDDGNAEDGEAGNAEAGNAEAGNVEAKDAEAGNAEADDVEAGNAEAGNVEAGNVEAGNVEAGNVEAGNVEAGNVEAGNAEADDVEAGNAEADDVEAGNAEAGNAEADDAEAKDAAATAGAADAAGHKGLISSDVLVPYITILARSGSVDEALRLLRSVHVQGLDHQQLVSAWLGVLKNEPRPAAFQKLVDDFHQRVGPLSPSAHQELVGFSARQGRLGLCKELLDYKFQSREPPTTASLADILKLSIEKGQRNLASYCAEALLKRADDLSASATSVLLLWYASESPTTRLLQQKMLELQQRGHGEAISNQTFNMLLDFAYRSNQPERAQKYLELASQFGLVPDSTAHALKLQYELSRGDLDAAVAAFFAMANGDVPRDRADVPALNKLLQKLSSGPEPRYDVILRVVDRVIDTGADLDADAVAGLCSVFLQQNDSEHLAGLVRFRVDAFSLAERERIIAVFKEYITDSKTGDQAAWNTYDMLRNAFPEISVTHQLQIMNNFFERDKAEFATLVFTHMHQRPDPELRPHAEAYAQCLFGVARCRDVDGLQLVYNMLKLDQTIEPTTKIHNSLMAAYAACRMPYTSIIDHWWKVLDSRDGPTLSSFLLALRACETWVPFGSLEARRIMALAQSWSNNPNYPVLSISKELYEAYLGAIAGQSEFENAVELIEHMHQDIGQPPDAHTIGVFYNAIPWQYRKDEVERWARRAYPHLWAELESWGDVIDEDWHIRYFNVDRTIDVDDDLLFEPGHYTRQVSDRARAPLLLNGVATPSAGSADSSSSSPSSPS